MKSTTALGPNEPLSIALGKGAAPRKDPARGFDAELKKHASKPQAKDDAGALPVPDDGGSQPPRLAPKVEQAVQEQLSQLQRLLATASDEHVKLEGQPTPEAIAAVVPPLECITMPAPRNALASGIATTTAGDEPANAASPPPAPALRSPGPNIPEPSASGPATAAAAPAADVLDLPTIKADIGQTSAMAGGEPATENQASATIRVVAAATYFQPELAKASRPLAAEHGHNVETSLPQSSSAAGLRGPSGQADSRSETGDRQPSHSRGRSEQSSIALESTVQVTTMLAGNDGRVVLGAIGDQTAAGSSPSTPSAPPVAARLVLPGPALRTLELQIAMSELGDMTARLTSAETGMTVTIEAASPEAAQVLASQRDSLVQGLASSGYVVDDVVVSAAAAKDAPAGVSTAPSADHGGAGRRSDEGDGQAMSSGRQGAGRDSNQEPSGGDRRDAVRHPLTERQATPTAAATQSRGLSGGALRTL